jgi:hypothetical protein
MLSAVCCLLSAVCCFLSTVYYPLSVWCLPPTATFVTQEKKAKEAEERAAREARGDSMESETAGKLSVVLQWCYSDVIGVSQWCYSGVTVML